MQVALVDGFLLGKLREGMLRLHDSFFNVCKYLATKVENFPTQVLDEELAKLSVDCPPQYSYAAPPCITPQQNSSCTQVDLDHVHFSLPDLGNQE